MNEQMREWMRIRISNARKGLEKRGFPTYMCNNAEELRQLVSSFIKDGEQVSAGGSVTLEETGVLDMLRDRDITLIENDRSFSKEEQKQRHRMAFMSDTYVCSANAITEDGEIYNVDGNGNRAAAVIFGPDQVLLIVSANKIVRDLGEAKRRVEEIAAPANCLRLHKLTPCSKVGHCMDCASKERICSAYVTIRWHQKKDLIKVIFVDGVFGY